MKRFTDTDVWKKPWFMDLTPTEKLAFFYVKDQCDNVGVWTPNFRLAEFIIGSQLDWDKFAGKCHDNIYVMDNGKWWLTDFCRFQHADLVKNPDGGNSNALKSYVNSLQEHGLYQAFLSMVTGNYSWASEGHGEGMAMPPKVRVKERVREQEKEMHATLNVPMNKTRYQSLVTDYGQATVDKYIQKAIDYIAATGKKPYKDYAAAAANYLERDKVPKLDNRVPAKTWAERQKERGFDI